MSTDLDAMALVPKGGVGSTRSVLPQKGASVFFYRYTISRSHSHHFPRDSCFRKFILLLILPTIEASHTPRGWLSHHRRARWLTSAQPLHAGGEHGVGFAAKRSASLWAVPTTDLSPLVASNSHHQRVSNAPHQCLAPRSLWWTVDAQRRA